MKAMSELGLSFLKFGGISPPRSKSVAVEMKVSFRQGLNARYQWGRAVTRMVRRGMEKKKLDTWGEGF